MEGDDLPDPPVDLCAEWLGPIVNIDDNFLCKVPRIGSTVIVEAEADSHVYLQLCDVVLNM